ncbi:MAG: lysophospholipid acyltransferase family protein [Mycobacterium sp.]|nr:lysophospholipid acyltransferase family protein [Mycobacterium sp.]
MGDTDSEIAKWDPGVARRISGVIGPLVRRYFRAEVEDLENVPAVGGALVVSNHSGGVLTPDVLIFAPAFYDRFGYDRPLHILAHYGVLMGPLGSALSQAGAIGASPDNAAPALRSDAVVLVFPGGDYDAFRPSESANVIDFEGRTGYVRTAIQSGVPIVPMVSIGGQETQWFLARGDGLARRLGLHRVRFKALPLTFGLPFGLTTALPANIPLPSKIVMRLLEPIDVTEQFGDDPDIDEVDDHVRTVMQRALDDLARKRRFPVLG